MRGGEGEVSRKTRELVGKIRESRGVEFYQVFREWSNRVKVVKEKGERLSPNQIRAG